MKRTKIYLLGPISPWNAVRSENFEKAAGSLRNLNFDVSACADFITEETKGGRPEVFKSRLDAALASKHIVLLKNWEYDEEAIAVRNSAKFSNIPIHSYDDFRTNYENYASAAETTAVTE
jgi:hypothetical protein